MDENAYTNEELKEIKKKFPYRYPGFWTRRRNKAMTVINLGTLIVTLATLYYYYVSVSFEHWILEILFCNFTNIKFLRKTFITHDLKIRAFVFILASEIIPRATEACLICKYTSWNKFNMFGIFLCKSTSIYHFIIISQD